MIENNKIQFTQEAKKEIDRLNDLYKKNYTSYLQIAKEAKSGKEYNVDKCKMLILSSFYDFSLDNVYVKKSKVHGRGVFAKKDIVKGSLITFYPGDIVLFYPNNDLLKINDKVVFSILASKRFEPFSNPSANFGDDEYFFMMDNKAYAIIGSPRFDKDPNYLGHLINDGVYNPWSKSVYSYERDAYKTDNCDFYYIINNLHVGIMATKDINKGEELFLSYGIDYWKYRKPKQ